MGRRRERILIYLLGISYVLALPFLVLGKTSWLVILAYSFLSIFFFSVLKPMQRSYRDLTRLTEKQAAEFDALKQQNKQLVRSIESLKNKKYESLRSLSESVSGTIDSIEKYGITENVLNVLKLVKNYKHVVLISSGKWHEKLVDLKLLETSQSTTVEIGETISRGHEIAAQADALLFDVDALNSEVISNNERWFELFFRWIQPNVPIYVFDPNRIGNLDITHIQALWDWGIFVASPREGLLELRVVKKLED